MPPRVPLIAYALTQKHRLFRCLMSPAGSGEHQNTAEPPIGGHPFPRSCMGETEVENEPYTLPAELLTVQKHRRGLLYSGASSAQVQRLYAGWLELWREAGILI